MADYTLYYSPSACSLSPHISLREAGADFDLVKVDLRNKTTSDGSDWATINPKNYVPLLRLPGGETISEGAVIVRYIADQFPQAQLAPPHGTMPRVRLDEWLHFIATEMHKGIAPLYATIAGDDYKQNVREVRMPMRLATLAATVAKTPWIMGEQFTVADPYAFYILRAWQHHHKLSLAAWPALVDYYARLSARPSVVAALEAEGITA